MTTFDERLGDDRPLRVELRRLRLGSGLSQKKIATLLGLSSHSAVADFESGKRIPANDIVLAYERVFALTGRELQTKRTRELQAAAEIQCAAGIADPAHEDARAVSVVESASAARDVDRMAGADPATDGPSVDPMPVVTESLEGESTSDAIEPAAPAVSKRRRMVRRSTILSALTLAVVSVLITAVFTLRGGGNHPASAHGERHAAGWASGVVTQHSSARAEPIGPIEDMDGDDPRARSCIDDAVTMNEVVLHLPDGSQFGTLRLRRSPTCGTEWGSAYYANPQLYTVRIILRRPADGAVVTSTWSNNTPPGSYGDMLSTKVGCVIAQAQVITAQATSSPDQTSCLR